MHDSTLNLVQVRGIRQSVAMVYEQFTVVDNVVDNVAFILSLFSECGWGVRVVALRKVSFSLGVRSSV